MTEEQRQKRCEYFRRYRLRKLYGVEAVPLLPRGRPRIYTDQERKERKNKYSREKWAANNPPRPQQTPENAIKAQKRRARIEAMTPDQKAAFLAKRREWRRQINKKLKSAVISKKPEIDMEKMKAFFKKHEENLHKRTKK